jgi:hypothetical protein
MDGKIVIVFLDKDRSFMSVAVQQELNDLDGGFLAAQRPMEGQTTIIVPRKNGLMGSVMVQQHRNDLQRCSMFASAVQQQPLARSLMYPSTGYFVWRRTASCRSFSEYFEVATSTLVVPASVSVSKRCTNASHSSRGLLLLLHSDTMVFLHSLLRLYCKRNLMAKDLVLLLIWIASFVLAEVVVWSHTRRHKTIIFS